MAHDAACRRAVFEARQPPPAAVQRPPGLFIQVDGTGVRNRATRTSMETKVGVVFSERAHVSRNRIELLGRRVVASLEAADAFGEALWLEAVRQGVEHASHVVFVSDGAAWTKGVHATHFPAAFYVLDPRCYASHVASHAGALTRFRLNARRSSKHRALRAARSARTCS